MIDEKNFNQQERKIANALKKVIDPELGHNLIDLGLVYEVNYSKNEKMARIVMTFTTPLCPYGEILTRSVKEELKKIGFGNLDLKITFNPPWGIKMIKQEIREQFMFPTDV